MPDDAATDLCVAGKISIDVTAQVDGVLVTWLLLHRPHLLLAECRTGSVDLEAKRFGSEVLAGMVHQPDLPLLAGRCRSPTATATAEPRSVHRRRQRPRVRLDYSNVGGQQQQMHRTRSANRRTLRCRYFLILFTHAAT